MCKAHVTVVIDEVTVQVIGQFNEMAVDGVSFLLVYFGSQSQENA